MLIERWRGRNIARQRQACRSWSMEGEECGERYGGSCHESRQPKRRVAGKTRWMYEMQSRTRQGNGDKQEPMQKTAEERRGSVARGAARQRAAKWSEEEEPTKRQRPQQSVQLTAVARMRVCTGPARADSSARRRWSNQPMRGRCTRAHQVRPDTERQRLPVASQIAGRRRWRITGLLLPLRGAVVRRPHNCRLAASTICSCSLLLLLVGNCAPRRQC